MTAQTLIGKAVSDDSQDKEINNAISRFRDRDIDGCRAILERAKSNNAKLPQTRHGASQRPTGDRDAHAALNNDGL